jgi:ketosteroid isomerase-like protein
MSRENVERVREAYAAYQGGGIEALFPYFAPDIEWDMTTTALDSRIHTGHEGVRRFFRGLAKTWEDVSFSYKEYIDAGDEVVAIGRFHGRGKASGVELESVMVHIWTVRDGMGVRLRAYLDREQALDAVGLGE